MVLWISLIKGEEASENESERQWVWINDDRLFADQHLINKFN